KSDQSGNHLAGARPLRRCNLFQNLQGSRRNFGTEEIINELLAGISGSRFINDCSTEFAVITQYLGNLEQFHAGHGGHCYTCLSCQIGIQRLGSGCERFAASCLHSCLLSGRCHRVELGQEVINGCRLLGGLREFTAEQLLSQVDGVLSDIGTQFSNYLCAGSFKLLFATCDDTACFFLCLGLCLCFNLLAALTRLLTDFSCLCASVSELCVVLLKCGLCFCLLGFSALDAALNPVFTLLQQFLELRNDKHCEDNKDD